MDVPYYIQIDVFSVIVLRLFGCSCSINYAVSGKVCMTMYVRLVPKPLLYSVLVFTRLAFNKANSSKIKSSDQLKSFNSSRPIR